MTHTVVAPRRVPRGAGFGATANFLSQYTTVFQTMMVARVAIWNLQWQVKGFVSAMPTVTQQTLLGRFVDGSDVEGIDLRASVVNTPWEILDQQTCRLLLINTVALYEAWCYELCETFSRFGIISSSDVRRYQNWMQRPDAYARSGIGIESVISRLKSRDTVSNGMTALMGHAQPFPVNVSLFSPRMRMYRLFKEARNSIAHTGAAATNYFCAAYNDCQAITPIDLGMRVVPDFLAPAPGSPVILSWRGIIGFGDMMRRLAVDVDHSLMFTKTAERDLAERLRNDPIALDDPTQANVTIKRAEWAKLPGGPWIVVKDQLRQGQNTVFSAISRLLDATKSRKQDFLTLWPDLLADGAVEVRLNLQGI